MRKSVHRSEGEEAGCPMGGFLEMLTRPWTLQILWLLSHNGSMRFGALRRSAEGISARLLTLRLRTLEEKGFVSRTVKPTNPPQVTYSPTQRLQDMNGFMVQLGALNEKWRREDEEALELFTTRKEPQVLVGEHA